MGLPIDEKGVVKMQFMQTQWKLRLKHLKAFGLEPFEWYWGFLFAEGWYYFKMFELQKRVRKCCLTKYK